MALATIDQLKEYVGGLDGDKPDKDDALLTRIVGAATSCIEAYCRRTFESTTYTNELYDGSGTQTLTLRHFPIVSVSSLLEGGSALSTGTDPAAGPDVLIYANEGQLVRPYSYWLALRRWYSVTYVAGYATVPPAIEQACLDVAALMLREKEHIGLSQKTSGTQTVTYIRSLPESIQRALDGYSDLVLGRSS